ncbi:hypothetical protein EDD18DRAFT_1109539 [Armillaria luteobubalina]|uniref:Uncharacterized protein n=1 Tax=Armillaria luteobubalina TaxID=153913 RepID=A0AA39PXF0_9AGAR|nr:hypothetical protein EDD18DRAFT_1109539 [Armillaria luteobubalina]
MKENGKESDFEFKIWTRMPPARPRPKFKVRIRPPTLHRRHHYLTYRLSFVLRRLGTRKLQHRQEETRYGDDAHRQSRWWKANNGGSAKSSATFHDDWSSSTYCTLVVPVINIVSSTCTSSTRTVFAPFSSVSFSSRTWTCPPQAAIHGHLLPPFTAAPSPGTYWRQENLPQLGRVAVSRGSLGDYRDGGSTLRGSCSCCSRSSGRKFMTSAIRESGQLRAIMDGNDKPYSQRSAERRDKCLSPTSSSSSEGQRCHSWHTKAFREYIETLSVPQERIIGVFEEYLDGDRNAEGLGRDSTRYAVGPFEGALSRRETQSVSALKTLNILSELRLQFPINHCVLLSSEMGMASTTSITWRKDESSALPQPLYSFSCQYYSHISRSTEPDILQWSQIHVILFSRSNDSNNGVYWPRKSCDQTRTLFNKGVWAKMGRYIRISHAGTGRIVSVNWYQSPPWSAGGLYGWE